MFATALIISLITAAPPEAVWLKDRFGSDRPCRARSVVVTLRRDAASGAPGAPGLSLASSRGGGARVAGICPRLGIVRVEIAEGDDVPHACERLSALPEARSVEPDWVGEGGFTVNDTYFSSQWHLDDPDGHSIQAAAAWDITRGSASIVVALLDTGIDAGHPEFTGRVLPGMNFVKETPDSDVTADHPHGLYTAGLLAANADNAFGVAGVDHRCRILPVKVLDQFNKGTVFNLVQGITWAVDSGARVLSMSLINFPETDSLREALQYARDNGVVLVSCAGNGGAGDADVSWPGASPLCISVGATGHDDKRAAFSGTGQALDLVAPGKDVVTVAPDGTHDGKALFSGCSAATPIVAGIASLLLSVDPTFTPEEVQDLLERGADDGVGGADDPPGWDLGYGWGRVNAQRSLLLAGTRFVRGDCNADGQVDLTDVVDMLVTLFQTGTELSCTVAADVNGDGGVDITDAISLLGFLFLSGEILPPYPMCGKQTSSTELTCRQACSP